MWIARYLLGVCLLQAAFGYYTLRQLSYTQLPTSINSADVKVYAGLDLGTATDAAYDVVNRIVYVVGETSHLMHVIDIADPTNPQLLFNHKFTVGEGVPQSIDICGGEIAVGLAARTDIIEGHVRYYHTFTRGSGETDVVLNRFVTVGPHPDHVQYTPDCSSLVIANEGLAGKDEGNQYTDPEGSVTIVHGEKTGNPSVRNVDFNEYNIGQAKYDRNLRVSSLYIPPATHSPITTIAEDIEPEYVTISKDGTTAWVTLQENSAIATIDISSGVVTSISPLPNKKWNTSSFAIDTSDRDGGVHRRTYKGLESLRQPGVIKSMPIGSRNFLFTADEGAIKSYTNALQTFTWTDATAARTISSTIDPAHVDLKSNASDDKLLGRLTVSSIAPRNQFTQQYDHLEAFGGRGFSIWDSSIMDVPVFDSEGTLEEYMETFYKKVFNCDYVRNTATYQSAEILRDTVSENMGAQVTGLDVADDNGTVFLVAGTWSTGTLFLYQVDISSGRPIPQFQSITRSGSTDDPWADTYPNKSAGDLHIRDIGIITSNDSPIDKPLVYVVSTGSGSLSLYEIIELPTVPGK